MKNVNWNGATYKDWVGLSAAPVFWIASLVCFALGLSFKEGTGVLVPGTAVDMIVFFSIGLGFANTAIQIVGNDTDREELGMPLVLMWGASYMLGIGSNVNFLYGVIGLNNAILQFLVCWGLGVMIEVAPERLLVKFLRSIGVLKSTVPAKPTVQQNQRQANPITEYEQKAQFRQNDVHNQQRPQNQPQVRPQPQQRPQAEPTYHAVRMQAQNQDTPPFLANRQNGERQ